MKKKEKLQECKKCEEYLNGWKRALADYENLKRDLDGVKEENRRQIKIGIAQDLLGVMDNFDQAVNHVPDLQNCEERTRKTLEVWLQGVVYIKKQFESVMNEMGIEQIDASDKFDESLHEAVEERQDDGVPDNSIIKIVQNGWKIGDRVLRPAKVIINKKN